MTAINRAALIEAAAKAIHDVQNVDWRNWGNTNQAPYLKQAKAALLVIAREMLAPLRELHRGKHLDDGTDPSGPWCLVCLELDPCRTMEMLDQIEADAKGDER